MIGVYAPRALLPLTVFLVASCVQKEREGTALTRPNILFILVDDLGMHDLGVTGSSYYETPNIDQLARESFVFTTGYSASRVCSPSRGSIMTGQYQFSSRLLF
jgi:arylsulfatase A-like enzyme